MPSKGRQNLKNGCAWRCLLAQRTHGPERIHGGIHRLLRRRGERLRDHLAHRNTSAQNCLDAQYQRLERRSDNFGSLLVRHVAPESEATVQTNAGTWSRATCAAAALLRRRATAPSLGKNAQPTRRVVPTLVHLAKIDHVLHVINRQTRLRDVRREDHLD